MPNKIFHREDYPFSQLAEFGLTEEMILDLPESVHRRLENGDYSPLLPIKISQPFGYTLCHAKFVLVETDKGVEVLFSPKLKELNLSQFDKEEQSSLKAGKVIVANIKESEDDNEDQRTIKAFVQIDKETNSVVYIPTQIIGRNLNSISSEFNLSSENINALCKGEPITFTTDCYGENSMVEISIGVDLFSENGVRLVLGNTTDWKRPGSLELPEYSFGNDGCWINKEGVLSYVPESELQKKFITF